MTKLIIFCKIQKGGGILEAMRVRCQVNVKSTISLEQGTISLTIENTLGVTCQDAASIANLTRNAASRAATTKVKQ